MNTSSPSITPDTLPACQALIEQLTATIEELPRDKEQLQRKLDEALRQPFDKRSYRYLENPNQLILDFGESDQVASAAKGLAEAAREIEQTIGVHKRRRRRRRPASSSPLMLCATKSKLRSLRRSRTEGEATACGVVLGLLAK